MVKIKGFRFWLKDGNEEVVKASSMKLALKRIKHSREDIDSSGFF